MRHPTTILIAMALCAIAASAFAADPAPTFTLDDQHEKTHTLSFPREKPLVISVADPGGARDAPKWTDMMKAKYGDQIEFWSIANLHFIPELGHGAARVGIRATSKDPVLCDWDGGVSEKLGAKRGQANIIIISPAGEITLRTGGKVEPQKLVAAFAAIEEHLPGDDAGEASDAEDAGEEAPSDDGDGGLGRR